VKVLEQTPSPHITLNVSPPESSNYDIPVAAGMDPEAIKDPLLKAEYVRRINENKNSAATLLLQHHVENRIANLKTTINMLPINLSPQSREHLKGYC
jgi:hypothetical protein